MDPAALAGRLEAQGERVAGSDAERRAAALCAQELRSGGRRPRTVTVWARLHRAPARALYAAIGIAGSLVAVHHAAVGLGLAAGALLAVILEAAGVPVASILQVRRATQNVVAPPPAERGGRALLVLTAAVDAPRNALLRRLARSRAGRRLPGAPGLLALALAGVAACAGARLGGAGGTAIGIVQLLPSIALLLLAGGFVEEALSDFEPIADGPAVALALAAALDAQPPRAMAVEVLIAGAGEAGAPGMAAYVGARRHDVAPEEVVVVHLGNARGPVRYVLSDGEDIPFRLHPRLIELAKALPNAEPLRGRGRSAARVARGARWPAIALEGDARPLAAAALRLISAIDRELLQARGS